MSRTIPAATVFLLVGIAGATAQNSCAARAMGDDGKPLGVEIQPIDDDYPLTRIAGLATDMGISDLAEKHAAYARHATSRDS